MCSHEPQMSLHFFSIWYLAVVLARPQTGLKFLTGKGTKYREIDVGETAKVIGHRKCQVFIDLHSFPGTDWGEKFTKKKWVHAYLQFSVDDAVINCFRELGDRCLPTELSVLSFQSSSNHWTTLSYLLSNMSNSAPCTAMGDVPFKKSRG